MIKFENVHKWLQGQHILKGINLHIARGETLVLVGPTGTGKSVSLKHLIALHDPDEGDIIVDGVNMQTLTDKELEKFRLKFGMLFQSGALLNWLNIADNVALPLRENTNLSEKEILERVCETLSLVGLEDAALKRPSQVSGGMRKRAGLARAIITEPQVLLYDEPTSGLDPVMSRRIDKLIVMLKDKLQVTSVVVTHDMISAFAIADKIAMIYEGVIVEVGTPREFRNSKNPIVQEFIGAQMDVNY